MDKKNTDYYNNFFAIRYDKNCDNKEEIIEIISEQQAKKITNYVFIHAVKELLILINQYFWHLKNEINSLKPVARPEPKAMMAKDRKLSDFKK